MSAKSPQSTSGYSDLKTLAPFQKLSYGGVELLPYTIGHTIAIDCVISMERGDRHKSTFLSSALFSAVAQDVWLRYSARGRHCFEKSYVVSITSRDVSPMAGE